MFIGLTAVLLTSFDDNEGFINPLYPSSWPEPVSDLSPENLSKAKVELGRKLFYDPILSADSSISCASCHLSFTAFTHVDHKLSHGIYDSIGTRNSPVLINLAWSKSFMWDGAVNHIEVQPLAPIENPLEMAEDISNVVMKLNRLDRYKAMFFNAFEDSTVTGQHLMQSIAAFQLTLISSNSKYDKVIRGEDQFSEQEAKGYKLFQNHCGSCHQEPLFTNGEFENNGLMVDSDLMDFGRFVITQKESDYLKFKVPTLRNIQYSKPYMHDGRYESLMEVLNHYNSGEFNESSNLKRINLSSNDKVDIISFLLTLTDKEFLFNPNFGFPRDI